MRWIGGFIGSIGRNVLIDQCNTTADTIAAKDARDVGGFIGGHSDTGGKSLVKNSFTEVKYVSGKTYVGGFIGGGSGAGSILSIENCYTKSDVYASSETTASSGGFAGEGPQYLFNCVSYGNVKSPGNAIGGFIGNGYVQKMESCYSYGEHVTGNNQVGGFFGKDQTDTIINCHTMVKTVTGNEEVGGFFGYSSTNFNSGCTTRADVEATGDRVGGYAGYIKSEKSNQLYRCFAKGNVQSNGEKYTGGFAGQAVDIKILECYATGNVKGNQYVGGLCGYYGNIVQCFATGNVIGIKYVGGLAAGGTANIENSFATGNVSTTSHGGSIAGLGIPTLTSYGTGSVGGSGDYIGGGFGKGNLNTKKCYFDATANSELSGNGDGKYLEECIGLSTPQFAIPSSFDTWDFNDIWQIDVIEWIDIYERPYLKWQLEDGQASPIISIAIENQISESVVSSDQVLVTIAMPFGSDITNLALIFELTDGAVLIINDSIQVSGVTINDFSTPLMCYIVYPNTTKSGQLNLEENAQDTTLWIIEVENQAHLLKYSTTEDGGLLNGGNEQLVEDNGTSAPVEAIPNQGYRFVHWKNTAGEILITDNILVIDNVIKSESFTAIFEIKTGISDIKNNDFSCYPCPTKGLVEIKFNEYYNDYIEVFSLKGEALIKVEANNELSKTIDLSSLKTGIYFIKVGNKKIKVMKQ